MMRILHVTDFYRPNVGGIEMFVEELAHRQSAAGHDVTVLTITEEPAGGADSAAALPSRGRVRVLRSPQPTSGTWTLPLLPAPGLLQITTFDVVHTHLSVANPFATRVAQWAVQARIPTIATVHSMWNGREGWVRIVGAIAGWSRWPVEWTAVSAAAAATMHEVLGSGTRVRVVPNAVEVGWWREHPPILDPARPLTLVAVMRLAGRKRPLPLMEVLARVRQEVSDEVPLRAVIVGAGPQEKKVCRQIRSLGLEDWVHLEGACSREEIRDLYRRSDLYLAPSHQESFGLAALEARAAGLPVMAMRSGGVGEFVTDGVEGILCEDDEEMTRALVTLAENPAHGRVMARHNRAHPPALDWSLALAGFDRAYADAEHALSPDTTTGSRRDVQAEGLAARAETPGSDSETRLAQ